MYSCFQLFAGIPEGKGDGYGIMTIPLMQPGADITWKGKTIKVTSGNNCPNADCGAKGTMYNRVSSTDLRALLIVLVVVIDENDQAEELVAIAVALCLITRRSIGNGLYRLLVETIS